MEMVEQKTVKSKGGRPKGSKNKPKNPKPLEVTLDDNITHATKQLAQLEMIFNKIRKAIDNKVDAGELEDALPLLDKMTLIWARIQKEARAIESEGIITGMSHEQAIQMAKRAIKVLQGS